MLYNGTRTSHTRPTTALNDTRRTQTTYFRADGTSVRGTGIAFTGSQTITDSANQLAVFVVPTNARSRFTASNNRAFRVGTSVAGQLDILNPTTIAETAGAAMELHRVG